MGVLPIRVGPPASCTLCCQGVGGDLASRCVAGPSPPLAPGHSQLTLMGSEDGAGWEEVRVPKMGHPADSKGGGPCLIHLLGTEGE